MAQKRNTRIVVDQLQEDPLLSFWRILLDPFFLFVLSLFFILLGGGGGGGGWGGGGGGGWGTCLIEEILV